MIGQTDIQRIEVQTLHRIFALDLIRDWSLAIDGGAHVGTWAIEMALRFERVIAFEPTAETYEYLLENTCEQENIDCRNQALLDKRCFVEMKPPREKRQKLTSRCVWFNGGGDTEAISIDELCLDRCGLIKMDLEGAEGLAILGAARTIRKCKPVLVAEITDQSIKYGHKPEDIHAFILGMGYQEMFRNNVDRVYA